jgi:hypothetical protein
VLASATNEPPQRPPWSQTPTQGGGTSPTFLIVVTAAPTPGAARTVTNGSHQSSSGRVGISARRQRLQRRSQGQIVVQVGGRYGGDGATTAGGLRPQTRRKPCVCIVVGWLCRGGGRGGGGAEGDDTG